MKEQHVGFSLESVKFDRLFHDPLSHTKFRWLAL
jgi:hypothetical protein